MTSILDNDKRQRLDALQHEFRQNQHPADRTFERCMRKVAFICVLLLCTLLARQVYIHHTTPVVCDEIGGHKG